MGDIIKLENNIPANVDNGQDLVEYTEGMLEDARAAIDAKKAFSVPIAELATLGAGVSSLIPAVETVTQTTTIATDGLYKLANAAVGDTLKVAKNGNFWGAFKTADGASKFAQLQAAEPLTATTVTKATAAINPATMMMAVALFSVEKELGEIAKMEKQIISFLKIEQEAKIEGDVETLMNVVKKYKHNWESEKFVNSNHKLMLDIQRSARANMIEYQKQIVDAFNEKAFIVTSNKAKAIYADFEKKFKYYRMALYTYSLASMMEVMLSGNFKESYIREIRDELAERSNAYRELFSECSIRIEKLSKAALGANALKGIGLAGEKVGDLIGNIPLVKEGLADEFLQEHGDNIKQAADEMKVKPVRIFADISNPGIGVFVEKLDDMVNIYNHTAEICFDKENIYLITG